MLCKTVSIQQHVNAGSKAREIIYDIERPLDRQFKILMPFAEALIYFIRQIPFWSNIDVLSIELY